MDIGYTIPLPTSTTATKYDCELQHSSYTTHNQTQRDTFTCRYTLYLVHLLNML